MGRKLDAVFDVSEFLDRPKFGAYRILIFALCTLVMTVDGYDVFVVGYLVPALAQDFGVPLPAVTSIFVFQTIGLGLGAYAVSPFADRFGRRNIVLICTALLGVLTLASTLATSVTELAAFRFVASFFRQKEKSLYIGAVDLHRHVSSPAQHILD